MVWMVPPLCGLQTDRAVDDFIFVDGAAPAGEILAVENALEALFTDALVQRFVGFGTGDFA